MKKVVLCLFLASSAQAGCQIETTDLHMAAPGPIKMFHATGRTQCQSKQNIGYWMDVELRDATDCTSAHSRLMMKNPCGYYNGQRQDNAMSIGYQPGSCTPLF
jgi:hypothetical protein